MNRHELKRHSKFLSLVLRHRPEAIGVELDEAGWTPVDELLDALVRHGRPLTREQLETIVRENDKQRFTFDEAGLHIRASQGHSVAVELGYEPRQPPDMLFHGTPRQFVSSIRRTGLRRQQRHHVHLHADRQTAIHVGSRRGQPVLLEIDAGRMHEAGYVFYVTPNEVWLTDAVPPEFIRFP